MSKVRVYEVAKQLNLDPKQVVTLFQTIGVPDVRNHMSSVEPEHVERIKRHLEKQKTHDVVEERIRPGVMKRRAVAKPPGTDTPSTPGIPSAPASVTSLEGRPSSTSLAAFERRSSPTMAGEASNGYEGEPVVPSDRRSVRDLAVAAIQEAAAAPTDRRSARDLVQDARDAVDAREAWQDATRGSGSMPAAKAVPEPQPIPTPAPSERLIPAAAPSVPAPPPSVAHAMEAPTDDVAQDVLAVPAESAPAAPAPQPPTPPVAAPPPVARTQPEPRVQVEARVVEARPPSEPPTVVGTPKPTRPSGPPKTGVEYWGGRPGVPMPQPSIGPRTGLPGGGPLPRRVQYDPRAGVTGGGAQRRDVRQPGPQGRGPMGSRTAPGARGGMMGRGAMPIRKTGGPASTQEMGAHKKVIRIEENITLQSMAMRMSLKSTELLMKLLSMGMTGVHINTTLDADTAKILAGEFGWEVEDVAQSEEESIAEARGEETGTEEVVDEGALQRSPVVTVMGHVDHGKTSLLDRIRKANVAAGEAGGITQHIGAYKVMTSHGPVVFLDTPGHEAFTAMRARGASVTDLVVLVVAADDGVMPQTKEAVAHAKSAKVPIIVAVNKIDKPGADPERAKRELVDLGLTPEDWGGDTMFINVSALTGEGVDHLLEAIGLQSEVLELTANAAKPASGTVIEALLDRGRGPVARVLVQDGTLRVGDFVLAGAGFGKVRAMTNEHGKQVLEAGPSTPVEILGLSEVPGAGDPLHAVKDPKKAQEIAESRKGKVAKSLIPSTAKVSLEELSKRMAETGQQELRLIVKGDVQGSVEALADTLAKLSTDKVRLAIIHAGVGAITEGDVNLAIASRAVIVGFNTRPAGKSQALAEESKIEIRLYSIIYNAVDDIRGAMEGLLPPTLVERPSGKAEVRALFKLKTTIVAGCYVLDGSVKRGGRVRLTREGAILYEGKVSALRRFKDDVKEVVEGFECGVSLDGFNDIKEKDIIESFEIDEIKQKL